jgi:hypothetical protein
MEQERIYHSYEEWQAGTLPWSIWGFAFGESGVLHEPEMVTKIHVLPEAEYQKIVQKQEEILGKHVACNLAFYVKEIEERLKAPGEIDERIEDEIREINEILTDKALNVVPIWYNEGQYHASGTVRLSPTGGKHVTPDLYVSTKWDRPLGKFGHSTRENTAWGRVRHERQKRLERACKAKNNQPNVESASD